MDIEWLTDVSPAEWIKDRLGPFCENVGSVIPSGYAAYARLFHPVERHGNRQRWSEIAASNGRIVHPEMQFHMISLPPGATLPDGYHPGHGPLLGSLPDEECHVLIELLRPRTGTPQTCWFCHWEGWGIDDQGVAGRVELPARSYLLRSGTIETADADALLLDSSPNLWWPDDRAWFVATEIDYFWTYVGGSEELIATVLADPRLEALPARLEHSPFYGGDTLNAEPSG